MKSARRGERPALSVTRRAFLTLSGATLLGAVLPVEWAGAAPAEPEVLAGRALVAAAVHCRPSPEAAVVRRLWPDSVTPVYRRLGRWYAVPGGFARQGDVQPMLPYDPALAEPPARLPAWVAVIAPVAPVRAWVSGSAPLAARIGYGGVLCAVDRLPDDRGGEWYAVSTAPEGAPLGWTPANRWQAVSDESPADADGRVLQLEAAQARLRAWEGHREVLRAPIAVPESVRRGEWPVSGRMPTLPDGEPGHYGAAWALWGGGGMIYGAHWHNDFGAAGRGSGWEVPPLVAQWLYHWLPEGATVAVG